MKDIMDTGYLKIVVRPEKQRTYCTMQGFWKHDEEGIKRLPDLFQQRSQQMPWQGTVMLDTTALRIMHPWVAEQFLPMFAECLLEKEIKALAYVGKPENVVLRLQFKRILGDVKGADKLRNESFSNQEKAEQWLDDQD